MDEFETLFQFIFPRLFSALLDVINSTTGTRTQVARVKAEYPNQLDYSGVVVGLLQFYFAYYCLPFYLQGSKYRVQSAWSRCVGDREPLLLLRILFRYGIDALRAMLMKHASFNLTMSATGWPPQIRSLEK